MRESTNSGLLDLTKIDEQKCAILTKTQRAKNDKFRLALTQSNSFHGIP